MGIHEVMGTRPAAAGLPALLLALTWLACPGSVHAYRDGGCNRGPYPNPPSVLGGVLLPAGDADEAVAGARRLGIGTRSCRDPNGWWIEGAQLGSTAVMWRPGGSQGKFLGLPTVGVYPLLHEQGEAWGCPWHVPMNAPQPCGARQVVAAIAVVSDLDRACDGAVYVHAWPRAAFYLPCGPQFDVPWMGARARDITLAYGRLRLLAPSDPEGLAARWLEQAGPRWVGITLEVDDVGAAAHELRRRGVPVIAASDGSRPVLIVEPEGLGGTLLEMVPATPF